MPKEHWTKGPPTVVKIMKQKLALQGSPAATWLAAAEYCWRVGYDLDPPPDTATTKLAELDKEGDRLARNHYAIQCGGAMEAQAEQRALARWQGMRRWVAADEKKLTKDAAAEQKRASAEVEAAVTEHAGRLRAMNKGLAPADAIAQARVELGQQ